MQFRKADAIIQKKLRRLTVFSPAPLSWKGSPAQGKSIRRRDGSKKKAVGRCFGRRKGLGRVEMLKKRKNQEKRGAMDAVSPAHTEKSRSGASAKPAASNAKGIVFLVVTAVVWGFAFVAQTAGSDHVGTLTFNAIRFTIGALSLIPVILLFEREAGNRTMRKTTLRAGLVCGVILFSASTLQQYGIERYNRAGFSDSSGRAGFLTALYMVIVPILGLAQKKRPTAAMAGGIVAAMAGLFLISFSGGFRVRSEDLAVLGCAVLFALHIVVIDRFSDRMYSLRFAMTQFWVSGLLSGLFAVVSAPWIGFDTLSDLQEAWLPILYGGLMSVGVAYTCQILGQKNADPAFASLILSTESMFSAIGGALLLHERMTPREYAGCALIFAGVLLSQAKPRRKGKNAVNGKSGPQSFTKE